MMNTRKELLKLKEMNLKLKINKVFTFDQSWKRTHYSRVRDVNPEIKLLYESATFDNQKRFGRQIANAFDDMGVVNVLALAPTQSGKTGSMLATIHELTRSDPQTVNNIFTPLDNIFIFTSHSSKEWVEQTKKRFPECLRDNIFHRNNLKNFVKRVKGVRNALFIFDECHIAIKYGQTLYKLYCKLGLFNIKSLYQRNIKLLHFTATPGSLTQDLEDNWGSAAKCLRMEVPGTYVSHHHYSKNKQLFQAKPLLGDDSAILEILEHMKTEPAFHLIRTPRGDKHAALIAQFKAVFKHKDFDYISEPSMAEMGHDFTEVIQKKPDKHTFLFIIDKIRCAKTINISHVNIVYDRFVQRPEPNSIIQGFSGRCTGYHKCTDHIKLFSFENIINHNELFDTQLFETQKHKHNIFNPC